MKYNQEIAIIELRNTTSGGDVSVAYSFVDKDAAKKKMTEMFEEYLGCGIDVFKNGKGNVLTYEDEGGACRLNDNCFVSEEANGDVYCILLLPYQEGAKDGILICVEYDEQNPDDYACQLILGGRNSLKNLWKEDHEEYSDLISTGKYSTTTSRNSIKIDSNIDEWFKHYYLIPGSDKESVSRIMELLSDPDVMGEVIGLIEG